MEILIRKCPACDLRISDEIAPWTFIRCHSCGAFLRVESDLSLAVPNGAETAWLLKYWEAESA
ncbi:MAG TPA: hypothetical protein VKW06_10495 [Candidatus Angelobacter sp.]|nr:hypothetical protein [Candidatus Angelobacter sp.]